MANEMTISQHLCKGLLRFILPKDTVTVEMEVMTLKGVYIFRQEKHSNEKTFIPWSKEHKPPIHSLRGLKKLKVNPQWTT